MGLRFVCSLALLPVTSLSLSLFLPPSLNLSIGDHISMRTKAPGIKRPKSCAAALEGSKRIPAPEEEFLFRNLIAVNEEEEAAAAYVATAVHLLPTARGF